VTADRYYSAEQDAYSLYKMTTDRSDLYTRRGIRVGDTREEVLEAYPELYDLPYWDETAADYLWYCSNEEGFGASLLFYFADGKVESIGLRNMFD